MYLRSQYLDPSDRLRTLLDISSLYITPFTRYRYQSLYNGEDLRDGLLIGRFALLLVIRYVRTSSLDDTSLLKINSFHTLANHSQHIASVWNQLDYLGIVLLVWSATFPAIYLAFFDNTKIQHIYWFAVSSDSLAYGIMRLK